MLALATLDHPAALQQMAQIARTLLHAQVRFALDRRLADGVQLSTEGLETHGGDDIGPVG